MNQRNTHTHTHTSDHTLAQCEVFAITLNARIELGSQSPEARVPVGENARNRQGDAVSSCYAIALQAKLCRDELVATLSVETRLRPNRRRNAPPITRSAKPWIRNNSSENEISGLCTFGWTICALVWIRTNRSFGRLSGLLIDATETICFSVKGLVYFKLRDLLGKMIKPTEICNCF